MRVRSLALVAVILAAGSPAGAQTPVEAARALVARYHEDPAALDRARDLLDAALAKDRKVETMAMLSYVQFLIGDVRATTVEAKLAAYDRGREVGQRAAELWGETKGVLRSLFLLPTIRRELDTLLELDPRSVRAHILAGNVLLEVPGFAGGDRAKAEEHFKKALAIDPRFTNARVDLARVYIADARYADARRELQRVVDETSPSVIADWTVKDAPRARKLLESIKDRT
jgi:tetratricopeptide (TPR) repeat protein